jgi:hypothetical protein
MRSATARPVRRVAATLVLVALVAAALVGGVAGGLWRAGAVGGATGALFVHAGLAHAALMLGGFFGTVIGIERAVALHRPLAFAAPVASGIGGLLLLAGAFPAGAVALLLASAIFVGVNVLVVRRQPAAHTFLLLAGALAWVAGNALFVAGGSGTPVHAWWFVFVVLTIAAERLEMARLLRQRRGAHALLFSVLALLTAGAVLASIGARAGDVLYGAALAALGLWFGAFDIARRTVHTHGLSRYMAVCLLAGYAWLVVAGVAWIATALGWPARDIALHALGLGFIFSMVLGHAPVILPAITRVKLEFSRALYLPLALLHGSLALRLADPGWQSAGAQLNALALVAFALTVAVAALTWRARHPRIVQAKS